MALLSFVPLDHGCSFSSDAVSEGIVATAGKTFSILSVDSAVMDGGDNEASNTRKKFAARQFVFIRHVENHCLQWAQSLKCP